MATITESDLRAVCARCRQAVRVRRQGTAWRMVAHKHKAASWPYDESACPVRGVDALPMMRNWLARYATDAGHAERRAREYRDASVIALDNAAKADASARHIRAVTAVLGALLDGQSNG